MKPIIPDVIMKAKEIYEGMTNKDWNKLDITSQYNFLVQAEEELSKGDEK